jgi:predicted RNase H-like HicB family nuclease
MSLNPEKIRCIIIPVQAVWRSGHEKIRQKKQYNVVIEQDEDDYYIGIVPELPGCHTQAKSLDQLRIRMKEAVELYLNIEKDVPKEINFIGIQKIEIQA